MKLILQDQNRCVLRLDKDEDVMAALPAFMGEQGIAACSIEGIGSASQVEMGFFNVHTKEYHKRNFLDYFEIISLNGTGAVQGGKPTVHLHGMFGRSDFDTVGGHVFKLVVAATAEIVLTRLEGQLERKNNPDVGLNLFV